MEQERGKGATEQDFDRTPFRVKARLAILPLFLLGIPLAAYGIHAIQTPAQRALAVRENNTLNIWTTPITLPANSIYQMTGEDSFDEHLELKTNQSVTLLELTLGQYVNYITNKPYAAVGEYNGTSIDTWFNYSHGCAGYVFIIRPQNVSRSTRFVSNVTAIYDPTPTGTGVCR